MTAPASGVQPENAELLRQATEYALTAIAVIEEGDLDRPTHCPDWSIGDLLLHLSDVAEALNRLADTGTFELAAQQRPETDIVRVVNERANALSDRLTSDAGTPEPPSSANSEWANNAAISGAVELTTHGWDISAALGQPRTIPDLLARPLLTITSAAIDNTARDPQFALPVDVDASQPPSDQLLGFLGREPHPPTA